MKTNEIFVSNQGIYRENALNEVEKYSDYASLSHKERIHIRILAEELLGMVEAIAGNFSADFWIEDNSECCQIHLKARVMMNTKVRDAFIDASTKKKKAPKGIMGKLRNLFEDYWMGVQEEMSHSKGYSYYDYVGFGLGATDMIDMSDMWSLSRYKNAVKNDNLENWDELEKSIIANLADDVTVGVKGGNVEMVITRKWRK